MLASCFADDRRVVPHESIASKHRPHHHLRGGTSADGSDRVRRFLEVSAYVFFFFFSYFYIIYDDNDDIFKSFAIVEEIMLTIMIEECKK